jgi:hypothetical protein
VRRAKAWGSGLIIAVAAAAALMPPGPASVERYYARWLYPIIQSNLTAISNRSALVLFDLTIIVAALLFAGGWLVWFRRVRRERSIRPIGRGIVSTLTGAALVYLWFLAAWGLNYARPPLESVMPYDAARVTDRKSVV